MEADEFFSDGMSENLFSGKMKKASLQELKELLNNLEDDKTDVNAFAMKIEPDYETVIEIIHEHLNLLKKETDQMADYITPYQLVDIVNVWIEDDFINSKLEKLQKDNSGIKSLFVIVPTKEMSADIVINFNKNIMMNMLFEFTNSEERSISKETVTDIIKAESDKIDSYLLRRLKVPDKLNPNS